MLDAFADGFSRQRRSPVLHTPADQGLAFDEVTFLSRQRAPTGW